MEVEAVDPRDTEWEIDRPGYRVYFHDEAGASSEYRLTGSDVDEVLAWADITAHGRTYIAYVEHSNGLIRLIGQDPNDGRVHGG